MRKVRRQAELERKPSTEGAAQSSLGKRLLFIVLSALSLWQITEQDIYWQIRSGMDLWQTGQFPLTDTWSFSAPGFEWMNIQWLSTLLFYCAYSLGEETALVVLRALLVGLLFALLLRRGSPYIAWVLGLFVFSAMAFRLQLRSDLLIFITFAALVNIWSDSQRSAQRQLFLSLPFLFLSIQLHPGTAPFLFALVGLAVLHLPKTVLYRFTSLLGLGALYFATPYHLKVLPILERHLNYYQHNLMQNPDHQALNLGHFTSLGPAMWVTVLLGFAAPLVWWRFRKFDQSLFSRPSFFVPLWALLSFMSLNRIRAIPFLLIFVLPLWPWALSQLRSFKGRIAVFGVALAATLILVVKGRLEYGFRASRDMFPVDSVEFIQQNRPSPELLHTYAYGAYTVWNLKDYKVFVDTRESPYIHLQERILNAFYSAEETQSLSRDFNVQTVLYPLPPVGSTDSKGLLRNLNQEYFPRREWALVFIGRRSNIFVRRTPAHAKLIEAHEYQVLDTGFPPQIYTPGTGYADLPLLRSRLQAELRRCQLANPEASYCENAARAAEGSAP